MASKTVAITRPSAEKDALTRLLHQRGYSVIHEPLTHVFLYHNAQAPLAQALNANPDAIIITSKQGVKALATLTELRDLALVCVGAATAHTAQANGFSRVFTAGGSVASLIEYLAGAYDPGSHFLYVSAEHVRVDLPSILGRQGMHVSRIALYEASAAECFSDTFVEHLKRRQVNAVTFLSQRSAQIFEELAAKAKVEEALEGMAACCLSKAIASALERHTWRRIHTARQATLASLTDCVDNALHARKKA